MWDPRGAAAKFHTASSSIKSVASGAPGPASPSESAAGLKTKEKGHVLPAGRGGGKKETRNLAFVFTFSPGASGSGRTGAGAQNQPRGGRTGAAGPSLTVGLPVPALAAPALQSPAAAASLPDDVATASAVLALALPCRRLSSLLRRAASPPPPAVGSSRRPHLCGRLRAVPFAARGRKGGAAEDARALEKGAAFRAGLYLRAPSLGDFTEPGGAEASDSRLVCVPRRGQAMLRRRSDGVAWWGPGVQPGSTRHKTVK
ncbi:uncharacterized protein LOC128852138 [Cuculus canorus]|uniref:uncharacterized protein LOC128852138 n=1 Tax=Cuculus canorus TaxID=55661 RepID=UPI0023AA774E|nr:uncharacterized protein LOC128852138 [Cuculus canorus]